MRCIQIAVLASLHITHAQQIPLSKTFLRLSPYYWAESLFNDEAHVISANETAEAVHETETEKGEEAGLPAAPQKFKGELSAFQLGENDLGFVRHAFVFDQSPSSLAAALRATASTMGPPNVLLTLKTAQVRL